MKKIIFFLVICFGFTLSGCKEDAEKINEESEYLESLLNGVILDSKIKELDDDYALQTTVNDLYPIIWDIDEKYSDFVTIELNEDDKQIIKVLCDEDGNLKQFELSGVITDGVNTATRTWKECYVKGKNNNKVDKCDSLVLKSDGEIVRIKGYVVYVNDSEGFWIKDETGAVYINTEKNDISTGDCVLVTGYKRVNNCRIQIDDCAIDSIEEDKLQNDAQIEGFIDDQIIESDISYLNDLTIKKDTTAFGKIYKIVAYVSQVSNGKYKYVLQDSISGDILYIHNNYCLEEFKGKIIEIACIYHQYDNGYGVVLPVMNRITEKTDMSDKEIVSVIKEKLNLLLSKPITKDVELYQELDGAEIIWESSNKKILTDAGEIGTSSKKEEIIQLTAIIKKNDVILETVIFEVTVFFLQKINIKEVLKVCKESKEVLFEGIILLIDLERYFYVGDETGVIYVKTPLNEEINVGDAVTVRGYAKLYTGMGKCFLKHVSGGEIMKKDGETAGKYDYYDYIENVRKIGFEDLLSVQLPNTALTERDIEIMDSFDVYGQILTISGYLISEENDEEVEYYIFEEKSSTEKKINIYSTDENIFNEYLNGNVKVAMKCLIYDFECSKGWRLSVPIMITEETDNLFN